MTTRLALRCCCRPATILGYLDVPDAMASPYAEVVVRPAPAWDPGGGVLKLVVTPYQNLTMDHAGGVRRERSLALKGAEHVDHDTLRAIPRFVEAMPDGAPADGRPALAPELSYRPPVAAGSLFDPLGRR